MKIQKNRVFKIKKILRFFTWDRKSKKSHFPCNFYHAKTIKIMQKIYF
jgi:hypothetical protein